LSDPLPDWYRYWGKAQPDSSEGDRYHLLVYHSLDVAACGRELLRLPRFSLRPLADALGWSLEVVESLFVYFLALHDIGKFSRGFQGLAPNLSPNLVPPGQIRAVRKQRHDTLGWLLWRDVLPASTAIPSIPDASHEFWRIWVRATMGHHGVPPLDLEDGGRFKLRVADHFLQADREAAIGFAAAVDKHFAIAHVPDPSRQQLDVLRHFSWTLAGLAVLADWLGSDQTQFHYRSNVVSVADYWSKTAKCVARESVRRAGLGMVPVRQLARPAELLQEVPSLSPLQRYAAEVELASGPQLFILEDVTGAGKTEAALLLAHRLMAADEAHGFYFALPTMATATQMYDRVAKVYRRMFDPDSHPSLILAHSARDAVDGFRDSIIRKDGDRPAHSLRDSSDPDGAAECAAWLADSRKKALLAEVGVGTVDQALLAVMPVRHQSLRMLGLMGKVLIVDEVHAYDAYMVKLLKVLLEHHVRGGGSVILLSATIPQNLRADLLAAFDKGRGRPLGGIAKPDPRYPLATQFGEVLRLHACETRAPLRRTVHVEMLHDEADVVRLVSTEAVKGRCVAWIRNTVEDARRGYQELQSQLPAGAVTLFHSRYALGDRLEIEKTVLARLGKDSTAADRLGQIVVGTQVLEQSLDYDVDLMVSDWAPIDLIIQRAGRLMRHLRSGSGDPLSVGSDGRGDPVLYVLVPSLEESPESGWYSALFPKGQYVYPDAGRLWLGADALRAAEGISTPGEVGALDAVRTLIEAVYGDDAAEVPEDLQAASTAADGANLAEQSMGSLNSLRLDRGYMRESSVRWDDDDGVPTRLGEESRIVYLAVERNGTLVPFRSDSRRPWESSSVRVNARRFKGLGTEWEARFGGMVSHLRDMIALLREPAFVLPLEPAGDGVWRALVHPDGGAEVQVRYDDRIGLEW
jgi:CRISPR-associated endonuclease/helicase Cas3